MDVVECVGPLLIRALRQMTQRGMFPFMSLLETHRPEARDEKKETEKE